jgi:hypothetical protein
MAYAMTVADDALSMQTSELLLEEAFDKQGIHTPDITLAFDGLVEAGALRAGSPNSSLFSVSCHETV